MNNFTFSYPTKVYFGKGAMEHIKPDLAKYGRTVLLAYGGGSLRKTGVYDQILSMLTAAGKTVVDFPGIMPNPTYAKVQEGAALVREKGVDFILAVGGGSVIDCCKIVSAQAKLEEDIWEMETAKKQFPTEIVPMGAVVTASGTGSEMNNGAVITHEERKIKGGMMGAYNSFAVLDPELTMTVPFRQVISGAFDTLSHAMETYFGQPHGHNNLSDDISEAVMRSVIANIRVLLRDHGNYEARSELMWASAMAENGILKIGKVTDFQCHQLEHQLGAYTDCNHGQGLAVIHPVLYRHICGAGAEKFARFARNVWGIADRATAEETAQAGVEALADFIREAGLPASFTEMGIDPSKDLKAIADSTNLTAGCCKKLSREELLEILQECV